MRRQPGSRRGRRRRSRPFRVSLGQTGTMRSGRVSNPRRRVVSAATPVRPSVQRRHAARERRQNRFVSSRLPPLGLRNMKPVPKVMWPAARRVTSNVSGLSPPAGVALLQRETIAPSRPHRVARLRPRRAGRVERRIAPGLEAQYFLEAPRIRFGLLQRMVPLFGITAPCSTAPLPNPIDRWNRSGRKKRAHQHARFHPPVNLAASTAAKICKPRPALRQRRAAALDMIQSRTGPALAIAC